MPPIRYVCLSDLHLGAAISLLTDIDRDGKSQPKRPGPVLESFGVALREFLTPLCGKELPTLVLLGDVFDLAFSPTRMAAMAFKRFIEALFPKGQPPVFRDQILYMPGNHDHREWQVVKDELFLGKLMEVGAERVPNRVEVTPLFHEPVVQSRVATALLDGASGRGNAAVHVAYPNFGYSAGERCVVMHHGHFVESMYRMVSEATQWLTPGTPPPDDIDAIEGQNGPWIDFLWSTFGDEGAAGAGIFNLYEVMQDAAAAHDYIVKLSERILTSLGRSFPIHPSTKLSAAGLQLEVGGVTEGLLDLVIGRAAQSERLGNQSVLSPSSVDGLRWYLAGPVRRQLLEAKLDPEPSRHTFIFGHTHKPFQDQLIVDGYPAPVDIYNTGGWVLDDPGLSPTHGAAAVFVDEHAHVASLRLFNDPGAGDAGRVRAAGTGAFEDADNPLLTALTKAVADRPTLWDRFSREVTEGIETRGRFARNRFFDPAAMPPVTRGREDSP